MSNKQQLVGNLNKGFTFIVSAPAGTGKSTLVEMLTKEFPAVERSISCTTRPPRAGEQDGIDYHFLDEAEFKRRQANLSEKDRKLQEEEEKRQRDKELADQEAEKARLAQEAREKALNEDQAACEPSRNP